MATAGSMAFGSGSKSLQGASAVASSIFTQARTEAIMRRVPVRVLVDAESSKPDSYLKRMAVVANTNANNDWSVLGNVYQASKWTTLPANAKLDTNWSTTSNNSMTLSGLSGSQGSKTFYYYEFQPNGQMPTSPQFVLSPSAGGSNQLYGFKVFRMGKMVFFDGPDSISNP
jgi:hypothetical protein